MFHLLIFLTNTSCQTVIESRINLTTSLSTGEFAQHAIFSMRNNLSTKIGLNFERKDCFCDIFNAINTCQIEKFRQQNVIAITNKNVALQRYNREIFQNEKYTL